MLSARDFVRLSERGGLFGSAAVDAAGSLVVGQPKLNRRRHKNERRKVSAESNGGGDPRGGGKYVHTSRNSRRFVNKLAGYATLLGIV